MVRCIPKKMDFIPHVYPYPVPPPEPPEGEGM